VTATREEIDALLHRANAALQLWLLLCSDLAIRSGTAVRLSPQHYDQQRAELRFVTKANAHMTLPVTTEIKRILDQCDQNSDETFIRQLWNTGKGHQGAHIKKGCDGIDALRWQFHKLCKEVGITRRITAHDLRRTTAVAMLEQTREIRDVQAVLGHRSLQSTIWYLDHDLRPVKRSTLELIKRPAWRKEQIA